MWGGTGLWGWGVRGCWSGKRGDYGILFYFWDMLFEGLCFSGFFFRLLRLLSRSISRIVRFLRFLAVSAVRMRIFFLF